MSDVCAEDFLNGCSCLLGKPNKEALGVVMGGGLVLGRSLRKERQPKLIWRWAFSSLSNITGQSPAYCCDKTYR